jgi:putative endonuclease
MTKPWFLYLIECTDGSIYTGITVDLGARYRAHCAGTGARYTRAHPPSRLLGYEVHADRSAASRAEYRIKQLSPQAKRDYAQCLIAPEVPPLPAATNNDAAE